MKQFQRRWGRLLLTALLILSGLLLSLVGYLGRTTIYKKYADPFPAKPWLTLVFEGIHDGIWPWDLYAALADGTGKGADGYAGADLTENEPAQAMTEEALPQEGGDAAPSGVEILPEGEKDDAAEAAALAQAHEEEEAGAASAEEVPEEEAPDPRYAPLSASGTDAVPEGAGDEVAEAVDYGSCEPSYLSPEGTVYNTDKEGPFARNGVYYPLQSVDRSYFSDALFIGDSRTQGLWEYGGLKDTASFCCRESVTTFNLLEEDLDFGQPGETTRKMRLRQVLEDNSFRKVYISLGINEVGYPNTYIYYENYREILKLIRELQPDAIIYIQGMLHVSEELSRSNIALNNTSVVQRNKAVSTLANGRDIFYLDMNPDFCDDSGNLLAENTGDGVHLMGSVCGKWADYLCGHAVLRGPEDEGAAAE